MANYVITYYGRPKFTNPADGTAHMAKWRAWMGNLGDAIVNPGTPTGTSKTLSRAGVSDTQRGEPFTGFSVIRAPSLDAAVAMAKGCPHLDHGTIDVAEAMDLSMT